MLPMATRMMTGILIVFLMTAAPALGTENAQGKPGGRDLLKRVLDAAPSEPFTAEVSLTAPGGFVRELALSHKVVESIHHVTYMEVTAPLNLKDTRFLLFERQQGADELFIWVPALNRVVPVREDTRKQSFLGSDFYVSDLVTPDLDAFTHTIAGDAEVGGRACILIESVPKDATDALYGKVVFAVDPTDLLIMRTEFFDPQGKAFKTWTLDDVEKIDGHWTPLTQQMQNVQQGTTSRIELKEVEYGADIDDEVFTRTYLKR